NKVLNQKLPEKWTYLAQVNGNKLILDPQVGVGIGNDIPGGPIKQEYVRDGDVTPPKDPPKADGIVGKWQAAGGKLQVEFTKDRKFTIAAGGQSATRTYSLHNNNTRLQVDLTEQERKQIQNYFQNLKLPKGVSRPGTPNHYHYNIAINGDDLVLEPAAPPTNSQAIFQLNVIPGGNTRQSYKRVASP